MAVVAAIAGGTWLVALRLGVAMTCLQAGIGAANDLVDAPADGLLKPRKPIPRGLVGERAAGRLVALALVLGLGLSALSGPTTLVLALAGTAVGLAYDLRLKGTVWSWLPFAIGIPMLPLYGWVGAGGGPLPASLVVLLVTAVPAGAALAIANALGDLERDEAAARSSVARALGRRRAWLVGCGLQLSVGVVAVSVIVASGAVPWVPVLVGTGVGCIAAGLAWGRSADPWSREIGWELQAVGDAVLAVAWLIALEVGPPS